MTRLRSRSAAVINWLRSVHPAEVVGFAGNVPPTLVMEILRRLEALDDDV